LHGIDLIECDRERDAGLESRYGADWVRWRQVYVERIYFLVPNERRDLVDSDEAKEARKLNYQVEVSEIQGDWGDDGYNPSPGDTPDTLYGKGTIVIDGERVKFSQHRHTDYACSIATSTRIYTVNNCTKRQDIDVIRLAIEEALWNEWSKRQAEKVEEWKHNGQQPCG
jgi:hypothetical protein